MFGTSATDVLSTGPSGQIVTFDGAKFVNAPSPVTAELWSVTGADGVLWAVGDGGTIVHRNP